MTRTCPVCHGDRVLEQRGESVDPYSGVPGWDPQEDYDVSCWRCAGAGVIEEEERWAA